MSDEELWQTLPAGAQTEFDAMVGKGLTIRAVYFLWEESGITPRVRLKECMGLLDYRARALGECDRPDSPPAQT